MDKSKEHAGRRGKSGKAPKRGSDDGRFMGVRIADPPVKPRGTTVQQIRRAVAVVLGRRSA